MTTRPDDERNDLPRQPIRLGSLEAYRGFVMLAIASGGLMIPQVAGWSHAESPTWTGIARQLEHVPWIGVSFWDMLQPAFMFMVGLAMPFSYGNRSHHGESWGKLFGHAVLRSIVLVLLGIFLQSHGKAHTDWTFFSMLIQIGLAYTFVFLVLNLHPFLQFMVAFAILFADWAAFAAYIPRSNFAFHMPSLRELAGHWDKNVNFAWRFDRWFLNKLPRNSAFDHNSGGYATLNFVPSIATMIFGVLAGRLFRADRTSAVKTIVLILVGGASVAIGFALDRYGIVPIVPRIWTPSWVFLSAGLTCWSITVFYLIIDVIGLRGWSFPFVVVGMNSIFMYAMSQILKPYVADRLATHLVGAFDRAHHVYVIDGLFFRYRIYPEAMAPIFGAAMELFVLWLICFWMYKNKFFAKV